jgi:uncharacterized protein
MPRPPALLTDSRVDAEVCARAGSKIERQFSFQELPRLSEAGAFEGSRVEASFQFSLFDGRPAIDGTLGGRVVLTCQRCMKPVSLPLSEHFQVLVVSEERADEPGGYEPVIADPARLDLRWLTEDQVLLALPLVPMHETDECPQSEAASPPQDEGARQQPFENLRDLLRRR